MKSGGGDLRMKGVSSKSGTEREHRISRTHLVVAGEGGIRDEEAGVLNDLLADLDVRRQRGEE